jgi:carbon storage regulator
MLVLTRHKDESIFLGDDIEITVVALCSGEVRLGIRAPLSLPVRRKEVYERIRKKGRWQRLRNDTGP